jgi:alpha-L-rhamnosidase
MLEPGYKKARIAPLMCHPALSEAEARIRTPHGVLANAWRRTPDGLHLSVDVPVNTEADILLPTSDPSAAREGRHIASRAPGVRGASWTNGVLHLQVGSGHYEFRAPICNLSRDTLRSSSDSPIDTDTRPTTSPTQNP